MGTEEEVVDELHQKKKRVMTTLDLTPLGADIIDRINSELGDEHKMPKAEIIRKALMAYYSLDLYREPDRLLSLYEAQYGDGTELKGQKPELKDPTDKGASRKATDADRALVKVWMGVYGVPNQRGVFYAPFLRAVKVALDNGHTYRQLEDMIRISKQDQWINETYVAQGKVPPIHVIFSEKNMARLILDLSMSTAQEAAEMMMKDEAREIRDGHLRTIKSNYGASVAGEYYRETEGVFDPVQLRLIRFDVEGKNKDKFKGPRLER